MKIERNAEKKSLSSDASDVISLTTVSSKLQVGILIVAGLSTLASGNLQQKKKKKKNHNIIELPAQLQHI